MADATETDTLIPGPAISVKKSWRRWFYLGIYTCFSIVSNLQSNQYSIIEDKIVDYFHVSNTAVDYTTTIFMIVYPIVVFPAMFVVQRMGLRMALIMATLGTTIGCCIKVVSVGPTMFPYSFFGQFVVAVFQVFSVSTPPSVAAEWFLPEQATLAITLGTFSSMVGNVIGYFMPPFLCAGGNTGNGLKIMFTGTAIISAIVFLLTFCIKSDPPAPAIQEEGQTSLDVRPCPTMKRLIKNKNFRLLLIIYTLNQAVYNAVGSLFTQLISPYYPSGADILSGEVGGVSVVASMAGTVALGLLLQRTRDYYYVTGVSYVMGFVGMGYFTFALLSRNKPFVYVTAFIMGFFVGGYTSPVMDFAVELTYPEPESIMTAVLTAPGQFLGYVYTLVSDPIITKWGPLTYNVCLSVTLIVGSVLQGHIKESFTRLRIVHVQPEFSSDPEVQIDRPEQHGGGEVAGANEGEVAQAKSEDASRSNGESEDPSQPEGEASKSNENEEVSRSNEESKDVLRSTEDVVPTATITGEKILGTNA